jgi:hypothetical protein
MNVKWPLGLLLVVAVLGVSSYGRADAYGTDVAHSTANSDAIKLPSDTDVANAALDFFFPTSAADFAAGFPYMEFIQSTAERAAARCMVGDGFPAPHYPPEQFVGDNTEFPDLSYLSSHGFIVRQSANPFPSPTKGMSASEATAYEAAEKRCGESSDGLLKTVATEGDALQVEWMNIVSRIDEGSQFRTAMGRWSSCMGRSGIHVANLNSFFNYLDGLNESESTSAARVADLHAAKIFAICMAPPEQLRDRLRLAARNIFYETNASAISQLRSEIDSQIPKLAAQYGTAGT